MRALLAWLALLGLAGCQSLAPPAVTPWPEHRAVLQAVGHFEFEGQLAAATATEGFSASARWQQQGVVSDLLLRAPFGVGGAHLQFDGSELQLTAGDGVRLEGAAAQAELVRLLGFEPPLASLRYWLLGVPDPTIIASETLDSAQRLQRLEQDAWLIEYGDYLRSDGQWLPGRVALRRGELRLKLRVQHWRLT